MKRRSLITAVLLVLFTAIGGWTAWWFFLATYAERALAAARTPDGAPAIEMSGKERFGFPFTVGLILKDARFTGPLGAANATATASEARMSAKAWRPRLIQMEMPTGLGYAVSGSATTSPVSGEAATAKGMFAFEQDARMELSLTDVIARPAGAAPIAAERGRVAWRMTGATGPQKVDIALATITLSPESLFGPSAEQAEATITLNGPWPADGAPDSIRAWQAANGDIDVNRLKVAWGALDLTATGKLALDNAFRPTGALDLELRDAINVITRVESLGLLKPAAASMAKILAASASLANGGVVKAPLTFADGEARLATFRIGPLVPVCHCR